MAGEEPTANTALACTEAGSTKETGPLVADAVEAGMTKAARVNAATGQDGWIPGVRFFCSSDCRPLQADETKSGFPAVSRLILRAEL